MANNIYAQFLSNAIRRKWKREKLSSQSPHKFKNSQLVQHSSYSTQQKTTTTVNQNNNEYACN